MKNLSAPLQTLLATGSFFAWDLYTIQLANSSPVLRYTDGQLPVLWNGNTYQNGGMTGPYFGREGKKAKVRWKVGVEVDNLEIEVMPKDAQIGGVSWQSAVIAGALDGALLQLDRAYFPMPSQYASPLVPTGIAPLFFGRVGDVTPSRSKITIRVNSHLELLNIQMPRNLYQDPCLNTLYDAQCTVDPDSFKEAGTAATGSTRTTIAATLAGITGVYDLGKITFTSGALDGFTRSIRSYAAGTPGSIVLVSPLPASPAIGDAFEIFRGCNRSYDSEFGCAGFSNQANFRATPFVPVAETAV